MTVEELDRIAADGEREEAARRREAAAQPIDPSVLRRQLQALAQEDEREAQGLHAPVAGYDSARDPEYLRQQEELDARQRPFTAQAPYYEEDDDPDPRYVQYPEDQQGYAGDDGYSDGYGDERTNGYFGGGYYDDRPPEQSYDEGDDRDEGQEPPAYGPAYGSGPYNEDPRGRPPDYDRYERRPAAPEYARAQTRDFPPLPPQRPPSRADAGIVVASDPRDPMANMPPVPAAMPQSITDWLFLANTTDSKGRHPYTRFKGWAIRCRLGLTLDFLEALEDIQDASEVARQQSRQTGQQVMPKLHAGKLKTLARQGCVCWNFPDPSGFGMMMQPPDGVGMLDVEPGPHGEPSMLSAVFDTMVQALRPKRTRPTQ